MASENEVSGQMEFLPSPHRPRAELEAGLASLSPSPKDAGSLRLIVRREADGRRMTPDRARLDLADGLVGDKWSRGAERKLETQLSVMQYSVAEFIANGQPLTQFGDNLFFDLDLSAGNVPVGARLRVGEAEVVVTPCPHNGCAKFKARFGADALISVNASETRAENRRGILCQVIVPGDVWVGAPIQVLSRPR